MAYITLSFLGGFEVAIDAEPVTAFGADKARALLAYLAIESTRPHRREKLSAMLWPDLPTKKAAHNLSQTLLRLRNALQEKKTPASSFLQATSQDIQFNIYSDYQLDVAHFRELINLHHQHKHSEAVGCNVCAQWLSQAAKLYKGDLLAGFFIPDSIPFEEWRLVQQEELHRQAMEILKWLTAYYQQRDELDQVQEYARRQIGLEPWGEESHLQLMQALAQSGQPAAAMRQYEQYKQTLAEELGIKPTAQVTALYEQIRAGELIHPASPQQGTEDTIWLSSQGERKQITTLACKLGPHDESEEFHEQITSCEQYCEGIFHRFGGQRAPRQGNICFVYFGYPQAFEDAARRAVHAGLAVAAAVANQESVQIGIHTGVMTVGEKRGPRWQDRDLIGSAFEVARDCQRLAKPGQVLITENTRRLVQEAFDLQQLSSQIVGMSGQTVPVYQVHGEGDLPSRLDWLAQTQRLTLFTGRREELLQLFACRDRLLQRAGQTILLRGEPGIGKSRLVWELKKGMTAINIPADSTPDDQPPVLWLSSQCLPHYQNTSLFPIISLLEQLLGFLSYDSLETRRLKLVETLGLYKLNRASDLWLLSILLGLPTDEPAPDTITKVHREQMRALFITLLQKRAGKQPLVIVIEDLHWSDPSTVEWLGHSIDSLTDAPCLTLLTARPGFNPIWLSHKTLRENLLLLALNPLSSEQAEQMVEDLAGEDLLDPEVRHHIVSKTDGIPLFVEELTKALIEHSIFRSKTNKIVSIPTTLLDLLVARLDHLGTTKETAQWAAVLGREFSFPVLQACTSYDEERLQSDLARLIEAELVSSVHNETPEITATSRYAFKHALMQEAAYASLLKPTRQLYHRRIAEMLTMRFPQMAETRPEVLAQHYTNAGMEARAADFWLQAGERATVQGATLEARSFFNRALEGIEAADSERRWRALLGREAVLNLREERTGQKEDIEALLQLAEIIDDNIRRAQASLREAQYALRQKDFRLMLRATNKAIASAAKAGDSTREVRGLAYKVTALAYIGEWTDAYQTVDETLEKLPNVTDDVIKAFTLGDLGFYFSRVGDLSRALVLMYQGAEAAQRAGNRQKESRLDINIGFVNIQLGRYTEARTAFEAGLALAEAIGDEAAQTSHRYNLSYALWCNGEKDLAHEIGEQALFEFKTTGHNTLGHACCLAYLGIYLEEAEKLDAAASYLAEARALYLGINVKSYRMEAQAVEARCMLALGQREKAQQLAAEVWEYVCQYGTGGMDFPSRVYVCLADVFANVAVQDSSVYKVVEMGYRELMERAEKLSDSDWRQSFLENVVENKAIVTRWNQLGKIESLPDTANMDI